MVAFDCCHLIFVLIIYMLSKLNIRNFAIISELSIGFLPGLNIITGETGAGKSILMGAVSLILGDRADSALLSDRDKKAVIEGYFAMKERADIRAFLQKEELDIFDELIIRREITPTGKSRAFINDTPVTLEQLRMLSNLMVDLHRQFDTSEVGKVDFQRNVLDAMAENGTFLQTYTAAYEQWQRIQKRITSLRADQEKAQRDFEYHQYLLHELEDMNLQPDELELAEKELRLMSQSEQLQTALDGVYFALNEAELPIVHQLKSLLQQIQSYTAVFPPLEPLAVRMLSAQLELQDIAQELEGLRSEIKQDPERLQLLNDRVNLGYKLFKKHNVTTTQELLAIQSNLTTAVEAVNLNSTLIAELTVEALQLEKAAYAAGAVLTERRQAAVAPFIREVTLLLHQVGMPNARLKVDLLPDSPGPKGMDQVDFLFDANKSGRFEPIKKVASGGELSRLMLSIKSLVASSLDMPTLIFDEIDTGISGEAAKQVGVILKSLAGQRQIICITHQPQIAGKADAHLYVYKNMEREVVQTNIRLLTDEERVVALAKMLGGEKPSNAALESAREMMEQ